MQISTLFRGCALAAVALVSAATFAQKSVTTTKVGELSSLIPGADRYKTKNLTVGRSSLMAKTSSLCVMMLWPRLRRVMNQKA